MDTDKLDRIAAGRGKSTDRQGGRIGRKETAFAQQWLGLLRNAGLELAIFKYGLNNEVAVFQVGGIAGGLY